MRSFLLAVQFLTIIPVRVRGEVTAEDMAKSLGGFVPVGLLQGSALAAAAVMLDALFHPGLSTALVLLVYVLSSGGFHLDGVADTFDALAARGDRERKLDIMKGGTNGAVGMTAVVFVLALKYLAFSRGIETGGFLRYYALFVMPAVSKWSYLFLMYRGKPARREGLGAMFINRLDTGGFTRASLWMLLAFFLPLLAYGGNAGAYALSGAGIAAVFIAGAALKRFFTGHFGGITGDMCGAGGEISEVVFLLAVAAWSAPG
jgi:adenosylcobinamide-GDP ribazoletransferase